MASLWGKLETTTNVNDEYVCIYIAPVKQKSSEAMNPAVEGYV